MEFNYSALTQKSNEQRRHVRIKLPLLVELAHPSFGTVESTARDISDGGLFVELETHKLSRGAQAKIRLRSPHVADFQHTPSVDVRVVRVQSDGIAFEFRNPTARHLWLSVERLREELKVGRDYFQIYHIAVVVNPERGLLVVAQHGKWSFPGTYLEVTDNVDSRVRSFCEDSLGLVPAQETRILNAQNLTHPSLPEASTYVVAFRIDTKCQKPAPLDKDWRWIRKRSEFSDLTVAFDLIRELGTQVLYDLENKKQND